MKQKASLRTEKGASGYTEQQRQFFKDKGASLYNNNKASVCILGKCDCVYKDKGAIMCIQRKNQIYIGDKGACLYTG